MNAEPENLNSVKNATTTGQPVDRTFDRIAVVSTVLGFAAVLGSAACLERGADQGLTFSWHWRALIWMALGAAAALRLWQLLERAQADGTGKAAAQLKRFCAGLMIGAVAVFVYPVLFVSSEHFNDVLTGLSLAAGVLTFVGWMISRVIKGFNEEDAEELKNLDLKK